MQLEEIKKLADLARIDMSDEEMLEIGKDFNSILAYVDQVQEIKNLDNGNGNTEIKLENVVRNDAITNEKNEFTDKIINNMPESQDGYLKVKQIL